MSIKESNELPPLIFTANVKAKVYLETHVEVCAVEVDLDVATDRFMLAVVSISLITEFNYIVVNGSQMSGYLLP